MKNNALIFILFVLTAFISLIANTSLDAYPMVEEDNNASGELDAPMTYILSCPDPITVNNDPGDCGAAVIVPSPIIVQECSGLIVVNSFNGTSNASDTYDIGTTMVTFTISDNCNTADECTTSITVIDNEGPIVDCMDMATLYLGENGTYNVTSPGDLINSSSDNCTLLSDSEAFSRQSFSCADIGDVIDVTVTVDDIYGNQGSCVTPVVVEDGGLPPKWYPYNIGQSTVGNEYGFSACEVPSTYIVSSGSNNTISSTSDNVAFLAREIDGDGSLTAKIESITPNGYGGLMIRETTDAGSKQVSIFSNMTNILRHETRYFSDANKVVQSFFRPTPYWLKLERQGNWIFSYYSNDGFNFQYVHGVYVPMGRYVEIGLASFTYLPNAQTEAIFSDVSITESDEFSENEGALYIQPAKTVSTTLELSIFPNPANNSFNITFEEPLGSPKILQLYNSHGQVIEEHQMERGITSFRWEVNHLPKGLYFLSDSNKSFVEQLVIAKLN